MENGLIKSEAGVTTRDEFGAIEQSRSAETTQSAVAARAQAEIQARYVMALQRPRDVERFRASLLKECKRLGFAEEAEYSRPVGREKDEATGQWQQKIARGPSIRLIESAIRAFGNVACETPVIYEDDVQRIIRASMIDLETNTIWSQDVVIAKRVEKRGDKKGQPPAGRTVINSRTNSYGETTYLVNATDDEIAVRQSALNSKAQRKNAERLLPSDIIHEAILLCRETIAKGIKENPDAAMRRLIDAFSALNIAPDSLSEYLGKKLEHIQPAELAELRATYKALADGEATWEQVLESRDIQGSKEAQREAAARKIAELQRQAAEKQAERATIPAATTADPEPPKTGGEEPAVTVNRREARAFVDTFGPDAINLLGEHGFENLEQVPDAKLPEIINAMKALLPKKAGGKLTFGKKAQ